MQSSIIHIPINLLEMFLCMDFLIFCSKTNLSFNSIYMNLWKFFAHTKYLLYVCIHKTGTGSLTKTNKNL